jgi:small subunit ribosomal protein S16
MDYTHRSGDIMAIKIRLTRSGSKKHPFYRVVATNSGTRRDGRPLEILGYYNPMTNPVEVKLEREKIQKWLSLGAEASDTVHSLLKKSA